MKPSAPLWVQKWRGSGRLGPQGDTQVLTNVPFQKLAQQSLPGPPASPFFWGKLSDWGYSGRVSLLLVGLLGSSCLQRPGLCAPPSSSICGGESGEEVDWSSLRHCGKAQFWGSDLGINFLLHTYAMPLLQLLPGTKLVFEPHLPLLWPVCRFGTQLGEMDALLEGPLTP